jgi:arylsulfatase A
MRSTLTRCDGYPAALPGSLLRRIGMLLLISGIASAATGAVFSGEDEDNRRVPNILLIVVDDLGWSDLACYGADVHGTPRIDRLARQSVKFTEAYAAAPVCSPTRASIMTGKHPARLHMTIWHEAAENPPTNRKLLPPVTVADLPHEEVTLAEVLHDAGYFTAHVGKWHLGRASHYPETQGFDVNLGGTFWGAPATFFHPFRGPFGRSGELRYVPLAAPGKQGDYLTDRLTDEAIRMIDAAGERPFFVHMAYHTVHTPIEGKPQIAARYGRRITPETNHQNAHYAAMVASLDENVGRLLEHLDRRRLTENTVVLLTSDNGGFVNRYQGKQVTDNAPLRSGKGSLYEGGVRVPLMVRWPGVTRTGGVCDEPVCTTDFYPTLLELLALEGDEKHNAHLDGVSIAPLLRDPDAGLKRDALFFHYPHYYPTTSPVSAVRAGRWKLLEYYEDDHVELYDLKTDMAESRDLAAEMPQKAAALKRSLHAWLKQVDAQMPTAH